MKEMFEGRCVDWNKFTAKDAAEYTEEAQKYIQEKEYINTIQEIARVATLGHSNLTLSKKLADSTVSKLKANDFNVTIEQNQCYTIASGSTNVENSYYWTTTIEW